IYLGKWNNLSRLNYEELTGFLIDMEKKYNLFSISQENIYIWKLIRVSVMQYLVTNINEIESVHGSITGKQKSFGFFKFLLHDLTNHPFSISKNTKRLIFENPRKIMLNEKSIDPYTHYLLEDAKDFHVIEGIYQMKTMKSVYTPASSIQILTLFQRLSNKITKKHLLSKEN